MSVGYVFIGAVVADEHEFHQVSQLAHMSDEPMAVSEAQGIYRGSVIVDPSVTQLDLGPHTSILRDESRTLNIDDILLADQKGLFKTLNQSRLTKGYDRAAYWLKITFEKNKSVKLQDPYYWIEVANPQLSHLDYYRSSVGELEVISTGAELPFDSRPVNHRNFIFPIEFSTAKEQTVYLRVESVSLMQVPVTLWSKEAFMSHEGFMSGVNVGYLCILMVLAGYNLFLYWRIKDRSYLMYVFYALSFSFFMICLLGYGRQYIWTSVEGVDGQMVPIMILVVSLIGGQFARSFLQTRTFLPRVDSFIQFLCLVALIPIVLNVLGVTYMRAFSIVWVVLFSSAVLWSAFLRARQGSRLAGYYLLGWGVLIGTGVLYVVAGFFHVMGSGVSVHTFLLGAVIEMVVFSLGLADRINSERLAKHEALALQDITTTKLEKLNSKLHSQAKELEIALNSSDEHSRLKGEFLCSVSHELRTPINGIVGSLELLDRRHFSMEQLDAITTIEASSNELLTLVDSILNFNEELQTLNPEPVNIGDIVAHSIQLLLPRARSTHWTVDSRSTSYPLWMSGDKERLTQLVFNLLSNALKYGESDVKIGLFYCDTEFGEGSIEDRDSMLNENRDNTPGLIIEVWNDGPPIPMERQANIFEPFTQGAGGYGRLNGGLGIGLALCKKMVELMGGTISFDSREKFGTRFRLNIPMTPCKGSVADLSEVCTLQEHSLMRMLDAKQCRLEAHRQSQPLRGDAPMLVGSPEVLIVEDNTVNRKILRKMLTTLGYRVTEACDGREGFLTASKKEYAAILMDCQMPYMDGFVTTENIRRLCRSGHSVPIIAITANVLEVDRKKCLLAGMNDYLSKPAKLDDIRDCLSRWVYTG